MIPTQLSLTWIVTFVSACSLAADPVADPFSESEDTAGVADKAWMTSVGFKVSPIQPWEIAPAPEASWPRIDPPLTFNSNFDKPSVVWRVNGGYLASFDRGEFGASLFYADRDSKSWTRILNTHIQSLVGLGKDTFVVAGGLAHLTSSRGEVHILTRNNKGGWVTRKIMECSYAVPSLIGTSKSYIEDGGVSEKLAVIAFSEEYVDLSLLGVTRHGTLHLLGKRRKKK